MIIIINKKRLSQKQSFTPKPPRGALGREIDFKSPLGDLGVIKKGCLR
jgi:hypothetical protein